MMSRTRPARTPRRRDARAGHRTRVAGALMAVPDSHRGDARARVVLGAVSWRGLAFGLGHYSQDHACGIHRHSGPDVVGAICRRAGPWDAVGMPGTFSTYTSFRSRLSQLLRYSCAAWYCPRRLGPSRAALQTHWELSPPTSHAKLNSGRATEATGSAPAVTGIAGAGRFSDLPAD